MPGYLLIWNDPTDFQQTFQELTGRGVSFPTAPTKMPFGWWSLFEDDDGTRCALEQRP